MNRRGFIREDVFERPMEAWERVDIQVLGSLNTNVMINSINHGLDTTADQMHEQFLSDIPHLEEVSVTHNSVMKAASEIVTDSRKWSRDFGNPMDFIEELDEAVLEKGLDFEITELNLESLSVSKLVRENDSLIKIILPERFGGTMHTYRLPEEFNLDTVILQEGNLKISFY